MKNLRSCFMWLRHNMTKIGLFALLPLLLVNCSCETSSKDSHDKLLELEWIQCISPDFCDYANNECPIQIKYRARALDYKDDNLLVEDASLVDASPFGVDNYSSDITLGNPSFQTRTFLPDLSGKESSTLSYSAKLEYEHVEISRFDSENQLITDYQQEKHIAECAGRVYVSSSPQFNIILDQQEITTRTNLYVDVPDFVTSGKFTPPLKITWSSKSPRVNFIKDRFTDKTQVGTAVYENGGSERYNITIRVESTEPDGNHLVAFQTIVLNVINPAIPPLALSLSKTYGLDIYQHTITANINGDIPQNCTWSLLFSAEKINNPSVIPGLKDTNYANFKTFTASKAGYYAVSCEYDESTGQAPLISPTLTIKTTSIQISSSPKESEINKGNTVKLSVAGSIFPRDSIVTWSLISKPEGSNVTIETDVETKDGYYIRYATLVPDTLVGSYEVKATVSVPGGEISFVKTKTITIVSEPVAGQLSDQQNYDVGDTIALDTSYSIIPPESVLNYSIVSKPNSSSALIQTLNGNASFLADVAGNYEINLQITNTENEKSDNTSLFIVARASSPPVFANASITISHTEGTVGTGYSPIATDSNGDTITYAISGGVDQAEFRLVDGELRFGDTPFFAVAADSNGDNAYLVEVTATDNSIDALSATQLITVQVIE